MATKQLDFRQVAQQADTLALIGADTQLKRVAGTNGGEYAGACPFCGGKDRFRVQPQHERGGRWMCRQCQPQFTDVLDYVAKRDNISLFEAAARLSNNQPLSPLPARPVDPAPNPLESKPPSIDWQDMALNVIAEAGHYLHSGKLDAVKALKYLMLNRGLTIETIKAASLGYNPQLRKVGTIDGVDYWLNEGIVIPCLAGADVWYIQVRTTKAARQRAAKNGYELAKYSALKGSNLSALYGADSLTNAKRGVIVEGEFDALLLSQYADKDTAVSTTGGATVTPSPHWRLYLGHLQTLRVSLDNDKAGQTGAAKWGGLFDYAEPLPQLPAGQDITDYWKNGGDLGAWLSHK